MAHAGVRRDDRRAPKRVKARVASSSLRSQTQSRAFDDIAWPALATNLPRRADTPHRSWLAIAQNAGSVTVTRDGGASWTIPDGIDGFEHAHGNAQIFQRGDTVFVPGVEGPGSTDAAVLVTLAACAADTPTGTVALPLTTTTTDGTIYRLRDGTFQIGLPGGVGIGLSTEDAPDATALHADLDAGSYSVMWAAHRAIRTSR